MKGRKSSGSANPMSGVNDAASEISMKPNRRNNAPKIFADAEAMSARKHGGKVKGEMAMAHAGRKPRKSGGRAGCESQPFTSAAKGTSPKGHSVGKVTMGKNA